jgi:methionine synthase I (cobalamin-dependent)
MGLSEPEPDGAMDKKVDDRSFKNTMSKYLNLGPRIIGTCCGSTPEHTEVLVKMVHHI